MKVKNLTAHQLAKHIRRFRGDTRPLAMEWARRVETLENPNHCIPKKKLRAAGLLPPVCL